MDENTKVTADDKRSDLNRLLGNREIKFRVWDNVDYMSTPFTLQDLQTGRIQFIDECKVMQFTGLKDKNGKEIYEGDIVDWMEMNLIIKHCEHHARFLIGDDLLTKGAALYSQVIGNIFENPELVA